MRLRAGVAGAIKACIDEYYPGTEVKIDHVEGLAECKKMLLQAKAGRKRAIYHYQCKLWTFGYKI